MFFIIDVFFYIVAQKRKKVNKLFLNTLKIYIKYDIIAKKNIVEANMKTIENKTYDYERALYGSNGVRLISCRFEGRLDGESALKESKNIEVDSSYFALRYPFWHDDNVKITNSIFTETARAPFWYTRKINIEKCTLNSPKAMRECCDIEMRDVTVSSAEFGWMCENIDIKHSTISGEYFMLRGKNIDFKEVNFSGKYSFQYIENATFCECEFDTKDAFWHAKNVHVKNATIKGEYLGWYSENLTLENCTIIGTQPLCYCKGLRLINCKMHECDLAFEKSEVEAEITTPVISIKNPKLGKICVPCVEDIILDDENARGEIVVLEASVV